MPESFAVLVSDLAAMELVNLSIAVEYDTVGCEFYAILQRENKPADSLDRLAKLESMQHRK